MLQEKWEFSTGLHKTRDVDHIDGLAFALYVYVACHLLRVRHISTADPKGAPKSRSL